MATLPTDMALQDELTFERLIETIAASKDMAALLVAVSDDPIAEESIVRRCEVELRQEGLFSVEVRLNRRDPSLRTAVERAIAEGPHLRAGRSGCVMVRGAGGLSGIQPDNDSPTEIDRFFGYLQWTREAIGQIPYPIVLWLTPRLYRQIAQKAPDFWSWRRGTFQFRQRTPVETGQVRSPDALARITSDGDADDDSILSLEDLQAAIAANADNRPRLARLWNQLGWQHLNYSNYPQAIGAYEQALELARELGDQEAEANSLNGLGNADYYLGEYQRAIDFHEQSLAIRRDIGDRKGEAISLIGLGDAYHALGECQRAIDFHEQSLAIAREIGDRRGEASSLIGLGDAYHALGECQRAIDFHEQSLAIAREIGDRRGEASSLIGLGDAYHALGECQRAIDFHEQSLAIFREIGDRRGEASSLIGLGDAYHALGEYQRAIDFHEQSLAIFREIGDRHGEAITLECKGIALAKLGKKWEAKQSYEAARKLYQDLGLQYRVDHVDNNLRNLLQVVESFGAVDLARLQEPRQPEPWELERFDQPRPPRPSGPPWWQRLWQSLRRWFRRLFQ